MRRIKSFRVMIILALTAASVVTVAAEAQAATCPNSLANGSYCIIATGRNYQDSMTDIATYANHQNPGGPVDSCTVRTSGTTCTVSVTDAVSTSVSTSLGVSQSAVSSGLSFTLSRTVTSGASCTSPKLTSGQRFVAYRSGDYKLYRVRRVTFASGGSSSSTSARLSAFQPYTGAHIICGLG